MRDMQRMFKHADVFDGNIGSWNTENVKNMDSMFEFASSFKQDISTWIVPRNVDLDKMFHACPIEEKHKPNVQRRVLGPAESRVASAPARCLIS